MWGYQLFENGDRRTYGSLLREIPRYYQTEVLSNKATAVHPPARAGRRAVLPLGGVPRAAPRVGQDAGAHGEARAPGAARSRALRARAAPEAAELQRGTTSPTSRAVVLRTTPSTRGARTRSSRGCTSAGQSLPAVDRGVEAIIDTLRDTGELDNTYVIFTSDHGFMQGEHRIPQGKMVPYDPSTQVPLLIRGPGIPRGRSTKALVGDVDLAATVLDAAGARPSRPLDGRTMLPYARNVRKRNLPAAPPHHRGPGSEGAYQHSRGRHQGDPAARAGLERGAHDPLALHRVQERPARDVRPIEGPLADQQRDHRPALGRPHPQKHDATTPRRPRALPRTDMRRESLGDGALEQRRGRDSNPRWRFPPILA